MRSLLLLLLTTLALLTVASAATAESDQNAIPDFVYGPPYVDTTNKPDTPRKTRFVFAGKATLTARTWYVAWNGRVRGLRVSYPRVPPRRRIPLVLAFHGAGGRASCDTVFGDTPGRYGFIVACLDGQGVRSRGYSYAAPQHLRDHSRIVTLLRERLPGLRIDWTRVIAAGGSMGGQEALVFGARYPQLVSTIVAMDAPTDLAARFWQLSRERQLAIYTECLGTPALAEDCFAERSPLTYAPALAGSSQTLLLYWSTKDSLSGASQSPALARAIHAANPNRSFLLRIGAWRHGGAWSPAKGNLEWLADAGLVPEQERADTPYPAGWRIVVDASVTLDDLPFYMP